MQFMKQLYTKSFFIFMGLLIASLLIVSNYFYRASITNENRIKTILKNNPTKYYDCKAKDILNFVSGGTLPIKQSVINIIYNKELSSKLIVTGIISFLDVKGARQELAKGDLDGWVAFNTILNLYATMGHAPIFIGNYDYKFNFKNEKITDLKLYDENNHKLKYLLSVSCKLKEF